MPGQRVVVESGEGRVDPHPDAPLADPVPTVRSARAAKTASTLAWSSSACQTRVGGEEAAQQRRDAEHVRPDPPREHLRGEGFEEEVRRRCCDKARPLLHARRRGEVWHRAQRPEHRLPPPRPPLLLVELHGEVDLAQHLRAGTDSAPGSSGARETAARAGVSLRPAPAARRPPWPSRRPPRPHQRKPARTPSPPPWASSCPRSEC